MKYIAVVLCFCLIASCSSPVKLLCNTWKIDSVEFIDTLNTFTPAQKEMLTRSLITSLRFTFKADSSYQVVSGTEVHNSKWWPAYNRAEKRFYTVTPEGNTVESKIIELKKNFLKFESGSAEPNQGFRFTCSPVTGSK